MNELKNKNAKIYLLQFWGCTLSLLDMPKRQLTQTILVTNYHTLNNVLHEVSLANLDYVTMLTAIHQNDISFVFRIQYYYNTISSNQKLPSEPLNIDH